MENSWSTSFGSLINKLESDEIRADYFNRINDVKMLPRNQRENAYHNIYYELLSYTSCPHGTKNIYDINSLEQVQTILSQLPGKKIVFLDWDDTIVHWGGNKIIEPQATKKLFDYLTSNNIEFVIITGRFWRTATMPHLRDYEMMEMSIRGTMYPVLEKLGLPVATVDNKYSVYDFYDDSDCVGLLYMGIMFGGQKGRIIKTYLSQIENNYDHIIFVDDLDDYLRNVSCHVEDVIALRRNK